MADGVGKVQVKGAWLHINDVAGLCDPRISRPVSSYSGEVLPGNIAMGELHGLTIGLDICSTLLM